MWFLNLLVPKEKTRNHNVYIKVKAVVLTKERRQIWREDKWGREPGFKSYFDLLSVLLVIRLSGFCRQLSDP